jgi:uncharacterized protein (DUF433 family)
MQLEDFFDFLAEDDIRLKGTRIGIETILYDYIYRARTAEEIADTYPNASLTAVYATILYYLSNQDAITQYLETWLAWGHQQRQQQRENPTPALVRVRQMISERQS